MSQPPESESPSALQVANYPLECRERFLALTRKGHVGRKSDIDKCLDDYNLWLSIYNA